MFCFSVILRDAPVGSPIVDKSDVLVAMNPSPLDKYEDTIVPGGAIFVNSTLIERKVKRTDVPILYVPATKMANDNGTSTLANMIFMGRIPTEFDEWGDSVDAALKKIISAKHADMLEVNKQAMQLGADRK